MTADADDEVVAPRRRGRAQAVAVASIGLALAGALVAFLWPRDPADMDFVSAVEPAVPATRLLQGPNGGVVGGEVLVAAERLDVRGEVTLPTARVLAADEIVFETGARIRVPGGSITLVAPVIRGAVIDVSPPPAIAGKEAGAAGGDGGTGGAIFLAAARLEGARLHAPGGVGADGQRGLPGVPGSNGYCGPRGFRLVERGRDGGDGGAGGDGGSGGLVNVLSGGGRPEVDVAGGAAGTPGAGGVGGRGGEGCLGARGRQEAQPAGDDGKAGRAGRAGEPGRVQIRRGDFRTVADAFEAWLDEDARTEDALRDRLLRVGLDWLPYESD